MMNPLGILVGGLATAGVVTLIAWRVGNARRMGAGPRMLRSVPEALERARRTRHRVLVAFVEPGNALSEALLAALTAPEDGRLLRHFELVRLDAPAEDRPVIQVVAAKYGIASLAVPSLLALDFGGQKQGVLEGLKEEDLREKVRGFLDMTKPGG